MSKADPVAQNPNEKQSPGKPLGPDEVAPTGNNGVDSNDLEDASVGGLEETRESDNGLGPVNEDEDEPGLPEERPLNNADLAETSYDQTSGSR